MPVVFRLVFILCFSMGHVKTTSPSKFVDNINGYRRACKSLGWEPKQDCGANDVVAFRASLKESIGSVPINTTIKFEIVHLNKGNGYDPATGVFTAPENGVYSFAWSFLTNKGGTVYIAAVVDNQVQAKTCIHKQQSNHVSTSGHLIFDLKKTMYHSSTYIQAENFTYFSEYKINSS